MFQRRTQVVFGLILVLTLLVAGACAGNKGFLLTGESLDALGQEFVAVGNAMNGALDGKLITEAQYRRWSDFARRFQIAFPSGVATWKTAVSSNDAAKQGLVNQAVTELAAELASFAQVIVQVTGPQKP